jgi:hypothetical protein
MAITTKRNSNIKSFARITINKLALVFTAAAFTVSTPCFAAVLSKAQGLAISGNIVGAEAIASSAVDPTAVTQLAQAINTLGDGINTMVDDLSKFLPQAQAATIKASVTAAQLTASNAKAEPDPVGRQTLVTSFNQLGNAIQQLAAGVQKVLGQGQVIEVNGLVTNNEAIFGSLNTQLNGAGYSGACGYARCNGERSNYVRFASLTRRESPR